MDLVSNISKYIQEHTLLVPGQQVLVGVSGGPDSLCLLEVLCSLGYEPIVAHFDHKLRSDSGAEAEYVAQIAKERGLIFELGQPEAGQLKSQGRSLEGAAREARYRFLLRIAIKHDLDTIAVGHNADDQVETVIMHFVRGTGLQGMRGMQPSTPMDAWRDNDSTREVSLIRPLLETSSDEIHAYCKQNGLNPRYDPSNRDDTFMRNRIRNQLLPILEGYNPAVRKAILHTSRTMTRQVELDHSLLKTFQENFVIEEGYNFTLFDLDGFQRLQDSLKWEFVRQCSERIAHNPEELDYQALERGVEILCGSEVGRANLAAGVEVFRFNRFGLVRKVETRILTRLWPQMYQDQHVSLGPGDQVTLNEYWQVVCSRKSLSQLDWTRIWENSDENIAFLSTDLLTSSLHIRAFERGDWFQPLGMKGRVKVSDYFIDQKIPSIMRDCWPMLVHGDTIAWVMGLRIADQFRLMEDSAETAVIELVKTGTNNETEV